MRVLKHVLIFISSLIGLLLSIERASAQGYDRAGLQAAAELRRAAPVWHESVRPVSLPADEPAKVWLIAGTAAIVIGAVVGGDGGTVLIVGGVAGVAYGVYRATK